jgi:hypothetical protein
MANNVYGCGKAIANANTPNKKGTICCRLYSPDENKYYLLTCNHVMHAGYAHDNGGALENPLPTIPQGTWVWGKRTADIDVALIEIDAGIPFEYPHTDILEKPPRTLTAQDELNTAVTMVGQERWGLPWLITGKIINRCSESSLNVGYQDGDKPVDGLIVISQVTLAGDLTTYTTLSSAGDSGALVYDQEHYPIGMAIAGNDQFTYVIPFDIILARTNCVIA